MVTTPFHEIQFPTGISYGAVGGPNFHTTITTLASGQESRNQDWATQRGEWDVAQGLKSQNDLNALIKFFYNRKGKAFGFRFKDWSDYCNPNYAVTPGDQDPLPQLMVTNGTLATFQLYKFYTDTVATYQRKITKPVANTLACYANGTHMTAGTDFTVDTTTGIVTITNGTIVGEVGTVITASHQFDVPVRFDIDAMKVSIDDYNNLSWGSISLVELKY